MSDDDLARELTRLVESTPGVFEVYPAGPAIAIGDRPRVSVTGAGDGRRVEAVICVAADFAVPETLRAVGDAIAARLADATATVAVRASRVQ
jgi:hypothetical protein